MTPSSRYLIAAAMTVALPAGLVAQRSNGAANDSTNRTTLGTVTITATRRATDTRDVAPPVVVIDSTRVRAQLAQSPADLLKSEPGVDVLGTGVNQGRPMIRGQRGQRILLLADGLRMNNSRRQQDFGELPALVDPSMVSRIEVVRGPASVLYGTDAIGGVMNIITRAPSAGLDRTAGRVAYEYGSAGTLGKAIGSVNAARGAWAISLDAMARTAGDYSAPAGTYGKVTLADDTPLQNSGVRDRNVALGSAWRSERGHEVFGRIEQYVADNAGFGYVPPALIGANPTRIQITYPHQDFGKATLGFRSASLGSRLADRFDVTAYGQRNQRDFAQKIFVPFGPGTPPGAGVDIKTANFTDISTLGGRAEATKALTRAILTYGFDVYSDNASGRDSSVTTVIGFGPPRPQVSTRPQIPNATLTSTGVFAQGDLRLHDRFSVIVGSRVQFVESAPRATAGRTDVLVSHSNRTAVWAANSIWRVSESLSLVSTVGSGFRSPNLVERYYDGPTPEGSAYQRATPDLLAETSVNFDGGFKYRRGRVSAELSAFRNDISDAIVIAPTGEKQGTLPVYQNVNVGKLRAAGGEASMAIALDHGFRVAANYSQVKSTNITNPNTAIGDTYANKLNATLGWVSTNNRFWGEYALRRNGDQKDISATASPVGPVLPAFTVQSIRGGIRGWSFGPVRQDITLAVNNLANVLYAETANASFFRPEPGRNVMLGISTSF